MKIGIITGASSGLGEAFAHHVAAHFPDIEILWLIARREDRLQAIAGELSGKIAARVIPCDLANPAGLASLAALFQAEQPDIRLLINNAGLGFLGDYWDISQGNIQAMCDVNIRALTVLTALAIPYMSRGGRIVMVSSIASFVPTPRMSVYSASKAYVCALSKGLGEELRPLGIGVLAVCPPPMSTEFLAVGNIEGNSPAFQRLPRCEPNQVAKDALRSAARGKRFYTPRLLYKLYRVLAKLLPSGVLMKFTRL